MSSTISDIRDALARRAQVVGLRTYAVPPPDYVGNDLPAAIVGIINGSYANTYGGDPLSGQAVITLVVAKGESDEGYAELDEFLSAEGSRSIVRAIELDGNIGLPDVTVGVMGFQNAGFRADISGGVWAADVLINYAKRS